MLARATPSAPTATACPSASVSIENSVLAVTVRLRFQCAPPSRVWSSKPLAPQRKPRRRPSKSTPNSVSEYAVRRLLQERPPSPV